MQSNTFDYYLRFDSEQAANDALSQYVDDVENVAIDTIGTLYDSVATDQKDAEGNVIYDSVAKDGFHVNVRSRYEINFAKAAVDPLQPQVTFF